MGVYELRSNPSSGFQRVPRGDRDRVLYIIGFFALILIAAALLIPEVAANNGDKIITDIGLAAMNLLG